MWDILQTTRGILPDRTQGMNWIAATAPKTIVVTLPQMRTLPQMCTLPQYRYRNSATAAIISGEVPIHAWR